MPKVLRYYCVIMSTLYLSAQDFQEQLLKKIYENNPPLWMKEQVALDLEPFKDGIIASMLDPIDGLDLAQFVIRNGIVYGKPLNLTVNFLHGRFKKFERGLIELSRAVHLSDAIFLVDLSDGGYKPDRTTLRPIFLFSQDSHQPYQGILVPDCFVLRASKVMPHEVQEASKQKPWPAKKAQAFWRGSSTGFYFPVFSHITTFFCTLEQLRSIPRYTLVELSKKFPDKLDAAFTRINNACKKNKEVMSFLTENGFLAHDVSIAGHLAYKYQILIDGTTSSWLRAFWQLWSGCAILKQDSSHVQWYYRGLAPYIHYLPFAHDCSNLIDLITWAQGHDKEMQEMADNAKKFAQENLTYVDVCYYIYYLLTQYAQLQKFMPVTQDEQLQRITLQHHDVHNHLSACPSVK